MAWATYPCILFLVGVCHIIIAPQTVNGQIKQLSTFPPGTYAGYTGTGVRGGKLLHRVFRRPFALLVFQHQSDTKIFVI